MAEFRPQGPVLLPPAAIDSILASGIDPEPWRDRQMYRRAGYSAFLMAWELVENQGGMPALREFLQAVAGGTDPDAAAMRTWGMDLTELAQFLDPVQLGEPIGPSAATHMPEREP